MIRLINLLILILIIIFTVMITNHHGRGVVLNKVFKFRCNVIKDMSYYDSLDCLALTSYLKINDAVDYIKGKN